MGSDGASFLWLNKERVKMGKIVHISEVIPNTQIFHLTEEWRRRSECK